ncbi:hypothetical protein KUBF_18540 [Bacteroides finegoldii]|nr:hypothetical protein KUBF_18540 [Bacteroides finegoldii]
MLHSDDSVDVLIIGGGASGVTAGIQSARMGAATLIVEETEWLGGMLTSAGVSAVDGNYDLRQACLVSFANIWQIIMVDLIL